MLVLKNTHMLKNQESSGTEFQRYGGPQLPQQKEKPHGKKNNHYLMAKEIRIKMSSLSLFLFAAREIFLFAASLYLFVLSLFLFAVRFFFLP